jgi:hypothetical protein
MLNKTNHLPVWQSIRRGFLVLAVLLSCLALPRLQAQSDTGSIVGTASDSTGAVIPGASITATNTENGLKLSRYQTARATSRFLLCHVAATRWKLRLRASSRKRCW